MDIFYNSTRNDKTLLKGLYVLKYKVELVFSSSWRLDNSIKTYNWREVAIFNKK